MPEKAGDLIQLYTVLSTEYGLLTQTFISVSVLFLIPLLTAVFSLMLPSLLIKKSDRLTKINKTLLLTIFLILFVSLLFFIVNNISSGPLKIFSGYIIITAFFSALNLILVLMMWLSKNKNETYPHFRLYPSVFARVFSNASKGAVPAVFRKSSGQVFIYCIIYEYISETGLGIGSVIRTVSGYWDNEYLYLIILHTIIVWGVFRVAIFWVLRFVFGEEQALEN